MNIALYFIVLLAFVITFTLEVIGPASGAECDKRWRIYAGLLSSFQIGSTLLTGYIFADFFSTYSIFKMAGNYPAPVVGSVSFFTASFVAYWWHRWMHKSDILWRIFHHLHHSPARIESLTSFYMHPFDGVAATLINASCAYLIFGANIEGAAWGLLLAGLYNLYIHVDLTSPYWLGYVLQRPEMHRVHHKRNFHSQNYGLPLWDLIFGTFENPKSRVVECGFTLEKEKMITEMLRMRKVDA
jgi:sterol desaturase/sphingolipid hydroxylase (fatty acid hydroxylase superfamily)